MKGAMFKNADEALGRRLAKQFFWDWITRVMMPRWDYSRISFSITLTFENLDSGEKSTRKTTHSIRTK